MKIREGFKAVRIRITKNDIKHGEQGDENLCPIARSLKRVTKNGVAVMVLGDYFRMQGNKIEAPTWVDKFVCHFDYSPNPVKNMKPRRKTVHLPVDVLKNS